MLRYLLRYCLALALVVVIPPAVSHAATATATADTGWEIVNFVSDIQLHPDTSVTVIETIDVDFRNLQKHGIYRTIPVSYRTQYGNNLNIRFQLNSVTDRGGARLPVSQSRDGTDVQLKIGDPERTVSGRQSYVLRYTASRVITRPNEQAEFYWNATGNDWPVTIRNASVRVAAPDGSVLETICFTGYTGSSTANCIHRAEGDTGVFVASSSLLPRQGLTVAVALDPAAFAFPTRWQHLFMFIADNWLYGVPLLTLGAMTALYWSRGRDKQYQNMFHEVGEVQTVPLWEKLNTLDVYGPPEHLSPGEVGVLVDEKVHMQDVTATVIDLARRGFLAIKELPKKGLFAKPDFELAYQAKDESKLEPFEQGFLDLLFSTGRLRQVVKLSALGKHEDAFGHLQIAREKLYQHMVQEGYFYVNPDHVRKLWLILGGVLIFVGVALAAVGELFPSGIGGWFTAWAGSGAVLMLFSPLMPARTAKGRKALQEVVGLREWIRLGAWRERIHEKHNFFEEVLPYTIAFGLTDKFLKAFNDAELKDLAHNSVSWYRGHGNFTVDNFSSSFSAFRNSMGYAVSSSLPTSASRGGSGFSGGSSGGGFGGGGGGSW